MDVCGMQNPDKGSYFVSLMYIFDLAKQDKEFLKRDKVPEKIIGKS